MNLSFNGFAWPWLRLRSWLNPFLPNLWLCGRKGQPARSRRRTWPSIGSCFNLWSAMVRVGCLRRPLTTSADSARPKVWIVDPIDGTREFLAGLPEWAVSVAFVEHGVVAAAGILNPWADQLFLGARGKGVTMNGRAVAVSQTGKMVGARVLASRSELRRGLWSQLSAARFKVIPTGSIAYKLALVASGLAEADAQPCSQARVGYSGWRGLGGVRRGDSD